MSEILITGMEMPNTCRRCIEMGIPVRCRVMKEEAVTAVMSGYNRPSDCPLVEVPTHGRLIDADVLMKTLKEVPITDEKTEGIFTKMMCDFAIQILEKSVTVLEASKERE